MRVPFIRTDDDVLRLLDDLLVDKPATWWDTFYTDRSKPIAFFVDEPDENLAEWAAARRLHAGRALDLGCGNGRNAVFLAAHGYEVEALDYSPQAIAWARERVEATGSEVRLRCESVLDAELGSEQYDFVYDSGCFHHLPPHRRQTYFELVTRVLKPGGKFGLVCFRPEGGSGLSDRDVYEQRRLGGGLGYEEEQLRSLWDRPPLSVEVLRQMRSRDEAAPHFGEDFLWTLLAGKLY